MPSFKHYGALISVVILYVAMDLGWNFGGVTSVFEWFCGFFKSLPVLGVMLFRGINDFFHESRVSSDIGTLVLILCGWAFVWFKLRDPQKQILRASFLLLSLGVLLLLFVNPSTKGCTCEDMNPSAEAKKTSAEKDELPELQPTCPPHPKLEDNPKLTENPNEMLKQAKPQDKPKEICTRLTDYEWEETPGKETPGKETPGKETPGKERTGKERTGKERTGKERTGPVSTLGRPTAARSKATLLEQEVKKVFDEIQARNNNMDTWYHHKFLLVGGLLAILLTKELAALHGKDRGAKPEESTNDFDMTDVAVIVFGAACVVSIAADIHIRIDATMAGMLGRWIANYVEPQVSPLYYWESFIRQRPSVHTSYLTQVTFAPHLHFLTWPMYLLHLWFFQEMALGSTTEGNRRPSKYPMFGVGSFVLVQLSLFVFVFVAHSTPYAHDLIVMDYLHPETWLGAEVVLWGFLCSLSIPYLRMLIHQMNKQDYPSHAGDVDG